MKKELILLSIIMAIHTGAIEASAELIEYDPFIFQLQFSEMVALPKFQLFLNSFHELKYTLLTKQLESITYLFQIQAFQLPQAQELEKYTVVFNNPLEIGDGRLSTLYFQLEVEKKKVEIHFPQAWGITMIVAAYLALNLAIFGSVLIEFLQIYCLMIFRSDMNTDLHIDISKGLMLLNPHDQDMLADPVSLYVCLCGPALLILSFGAIGFLVKRFMGKREKIGHKFAYQVVVYDLFICLSLAFVLPMTFNSIQFFSLLSRGKIKKNTMQADVGSFVSYLCLATLVSVTYLFLYVLNPKIEQKESSWKVYQTSEAYHSFRRLHQILIQERWYTRNKNVISTIKKILIVLCFFIQPGFEICVFFLQFFHIIYIFLVQPYRQGHYLNISISCRVLMFLFYGTVIAAKSYFSIGYAMLNFNSIKNFLIARDVAFLVVCLAILASISYEIYVKCSNLNYRIRLIREENEYKLKIIDRTTKSEKSVRRRKRITQLTSFNDDFEPQIRGGWNSIDKRQRKLLTEIIMDK